MRLRFVGSSILHGLLVIPSYERSERKKGKCSTTQCSMRYCSTVRCGKVRYMRGSFSDTFHVLDSEPYEKELSCA